MAQDTLILPLDPHLPAPTGAESAPPGLRVGCASHVGLVRTSNQDAVLWLAGQDIGQADQRSYGLFVIADGMGGHEEGDRASAAAARGAASVLVRELIAPALSGSENDSGRPTLHDIFAAAFEEAKQAVCHAAPHGGTTLTCVLLMSGILIVGHAGDTRAYLVTDKLHRLTHDHSLVQRLQDLGQLTSEEAAAYPNRNVIYRAIGRGDPAPPDVVIRPAPARGTLLLCSDGLWGVVPEERMLTQLQAEDDPGAVCKRLVADALAAGGPDNITALVVRF